MLLGAERLRCNDVGKCRHLLQPQAGEEVRVSIGGIDDALGVYRASASREPEPAGLALDTGHSGAFEQASACAARQALQPIQPFHWIDAATSRFPTSPKEARRSDTGLEPVAIDPLQPPNSKRLKKLQLLANSSCISGRRCDTQKSATLVLAIDGVLADHRFELGNRAHHELVRLTYPLLAVQHTHETH